MAYQIEQEGNPSLAEQTNDQLIKKIRNAGYSFPVTVNFLEHEVKVIRDADSNTQYTRKPQSKMIRLKGEDPKGGGMVRCFTSKTPHPTSIGVFNYMPNSVTFTRQKAINDPKLAYYLVFHAPNIEGNEISKSPLHRSTTTLMRIQDQAKEAAVRVRARVQRSRLTSMAGVVEESSAKEKERLFMMADVLGVRYQKGDPIEILSDAVFTKVNTLSPKQLESLDNKLKTNQQTGEYSLARSLEDAGVVKYGNNGSKGWWKIAGVDGKYAETAGSTFPIENDKYEALTGFMNADEKLSASLKEDLEIALAGTEEPAS